MLQADVVTIDKVGDVFDIALKDGEHDKDICPYIGNGWEILSADRFDGRRIPIRREFRPYGAAACARADSVGGCAQYMPKNAGFNIEKRWFYLVPE